MTKEFYTELVSELKRGKLDKDLATKVKIRLTKKYNLNKIPSDIEVFLNIPESEARQLKQQQLRIKPVRTISGIASISIMTKPYSCPHGRCTFCPGGPKSAFGDVPQSYTGKEPATMRAIRAGFDPYLQVFSRLEQYAVTGQAFDKVELIIQGGTFPWMPQDYKEEFVGYVFKAMNDFSKEFFWKGSDEIDLRHYKEFFEMPGEFKNEERVKRVTERMLQLKNQNSRNSNENVSDFLLEQQKINENAKVRCIGLTIETKPDWGKASHGDHMLKLGCTRVELGIESVYEQQLKLTNRGHTINDTKESLQQLKDIGLKINAHYMLGLPGSSRETDLEGLKELFSNPDYKPDMLKIYPCLVIKGTPLYTQWQQGKFKPITTAEAAEVISEFKRFVPKWCRIMRVNRDIPTYVTSAGIDRTNLRQYVQQMQQQKGIICNCIRCREIGRKGWSGSSDITVTEYKGSGGKEFFIAAEDPVNDAIIGFCRMRFPSQQLRSEITQTTAIIRELHVYATAVAIGIEPDEKSKLQHRGFGRKLMAKAEEIAKKDEMDKMLVISGVGAREYYKKLGYDYDGAYMGKRLKR